MCEEYLGFIPHRYDSELDLQLHLGEMSARSLPPEKKRERNDLTHLLKKVSCLAEEGRFFYRSWIKAPEDFDYSCELVEKGTIPTDHILPPGELDARLANRRFRRLAGVY